MNRRIRAQPPLVIPAAYSIDNAARFHRFRPCLARPAAVRRLGCPAATPKGCCQWISACRQDNLDIAFRQAVGDEMRVVVALFGEGQPGIEVDIALGNFPENTLFRRSHYLETTTYSCRRVLIQAEIEATVIRCFSNIGGPGIGAIPHSQLTGFCGKQLW